MKYKYSRKEINVFLENALIYQIDSKDRDWVKYSKLLFDIRKDLLALADKPKEEICPKCLGKNGCMCALKPKETGKDLIKRKMKEGKQEQDLLTKTYFAGMSDSLKEWTTPPKTKPEIEPIRDKHMNNNKHTTPTEILWWKINEIIDYLNLPPNTNK